MVAFVDPLRNRFVAYMPALGCSSSGHLEPSATNMSSRRFERLQRRVEDLMHGPSDVDHACSSLDSSMTSARATPLAEEEAINLMRAMYHETTITQGLNIRGHDLAPTCVRLRAALNAIGSKHLECDLFTTILRTIWQETVRQKHPKAAVLVLPYIAVHPRVLESISSDYHTQNLLLEIFSKLLETSRHRIYVFSSLAQAIHASLPVANIAALPIVEHFILEFARNPPSAYAEIELEAIMATKLQELSAKRSYESYYGPSQGSGYAYVFDTVNHLPRSKYYDVLAQQLLAKLLAPWLNQREPIPVFTPWKSTTMLQIIIVLLSRCLSIATTEERCRGQRST